MSKEQRFEKVVNYEGVDFFRYSYIFTGLIFLLILFFEVYLVNLIPEWGNSFFPIGALSFGLMIIFIFSLIISLRRDVVWRKIK